MEIIENGGITLPKGFLASGIWSGIKKSTDPDIMLLVSETECAAAGMFTVNSVKAAPVLVDIEKNKSGKGRAILANSGNANACTGSQGMDDAVTMCSLAATHLGISEQEVFVCSTGVIGQYLPMDKIRNAVPELVKQLAITGGDSAARAIMTTDTKEKKIGVKLSINGGTIFIGGIAKGSGMIKPNMATMLSFITTDAKIESGLLQKLLLNAGNKTFNMITVDSDTSTNDTVLMLANGASGINITEGTPSEKSFFEALMHVCEKLAKDIVSDGEGITKLVKIEVKNAKSFEDAKKMAFSIADSPLVKTALFAEDANWGRIIAAAGKSGAEINFDISDLYFNGLKLVEKGKWLGNEREQEVSKKLKNKEITITLDLHLGTEHARIYTIDLSYDYIKINASYRS